MVMMNGLSRIDGCQEENFTRTQVCRKRRMRNSAGEGESRRQKRPAAEYAPHRGFAKGMNRVKHLHHNSTQTTHITHLHSRGDGKAIGNSLFWFFLGRNKPHIRTIVRQENSPGRLRAFADSDPAPEMGDSAAESAMFSAIEAAA
jgi:hypothetical protein